MTTTAPSPSSNAQASWKTIEPLSACREALHRKPFLVEHPLVGHPLFTVEALVAVAKEAAKRPGDLYADAGDVKVTDKWGHIPMPDRPVDEVMNRIENAGAWIIMKHVEINPAYAKVLNDFADFVRDVSRPDDRYLLNSPEMLVLVTSPRRVTSFHFDAEVNFLVQIQGSKNVWVCDPADRSVVTHEEIERYYSGHQNAGTFKPGVEEKAWHYNLQPGQAVHIPTHGAHWVKNGDNVSVSLSLNFELPNSMYRYPAIANYGLRRLGIKPAPLGGMNTQSPVKSLAGGMIFNCHRLAKRAKSVFKA
jgi:hypothetical protein